LDANIFVYAFYKPRKTLSKEAITRKENAQRVVAEINSGKLNVITSVVHLAETANILKHGLSIRETNILLATLMSLKNVNVISVTKEDYENAISLGALLNLDPNDALAVYFMRKFGIKEILSYDKDFDKVKDITRVVS